MEPPLSLRELLPRLRQEKLLVLYEAGGAPLSSLVSPADTALSLFIGPEGGIAPEELAALQEAGGIPVTLGRRILRCETAPLCALSAVMCLSGNLE